MNKMLLVAAALIALEAGSSCFAQLTAKPPARPQLLFQVNKQTFPAYWCDASINMKAESLSKSDFAQASRALRKGLKRYPPSFLADHLKKVYALQNLTLKGVEIGGTSCSESKTVYVNTRSRSYLYPLEALPESLHHETGHLVAAQPEAHFDAACWSALNPKEFHYGKGGLEAIKKGLDAEEWDERYYPKGFVSLYAQSDPHEDFACLAQRLFSGDKSFWQAVDQHPRLAKKVEYAISVYHRLDKSFTRQFFQTLSPPPPLPGQVVVFPNGGTVYEMTAERRILTTSVRAGGSAIYPAHGIVVFHSVGEGNVEKEKYLASLKVMLTEVCLLLTVPFAFAIVFCISKFRAVSNTSHRS